MKFIYYLSVLAIFSFASISCKKKVEKKEVTPSFYIKENSNMHQQKSFDSILNCGYYTYGEGFFITADHGCVYNPQENNSFGNIIIFLIPKHKNEKSDIDYEEYVNTLEASTLKKDFEIYLYIIPYKYLSETPEGYYQNRHHLYEVYKFNRTDNSWKLLRSKFVNTLQERQSEFNIVMNFIKDKTTFQE